MTEISQPQRTFLSRRNLLLGGAGLVVLAAGAGGAARYALRPAVTGHLITPVEAHDLAVSGGATLVDIRRPDEWRRTGVGQGAHPLDLRRDDFTDALSTLVNGDLAAPIILICAGGVRSRILSEKLEQAGFSHIIDVPEGMQGSRAGPGWLRRDLPVVTYQ